MKDFTSVIEIDQSNANAYFNRGCCYDSIGELDLAISDYSVALELDLRSGNGEDDAGEAIEKENINSNGNRAGGPSEGQTLVDEEDDEIVDVNDSEYATSNRNTNRKNIHIT